MFTTAAGTQSPGSRDELIAALLAQLALLPLEDRIRAGRWLADAATARAVGAATDAAVFELSRTTTYADVARRLGVSEAAVNKAVTSHRRRAKGQVGT
jgi:hypothetical protein